MGLDFLTWGVHILIGKRTLSIILSFYVFIDKKNISSSHEPVFGKKRLAEREGFWGRGSSGMHCGEF